MPDADSTPGERVKSGVVSRWHMTIEDDDAIELERLVQRRLQVCSQPRRQLTPAQVEQRTQAIFVVATLLRVPMDWTVSTKREVVEPLVAVYGGRIEQVIRVEVLPKQGWGLAVGKSPRQVKDGISVVVCPCDVMYYPQRTYYAAGWFTRFGATVKGLAETWHSRKDGEAREWTSWMMPYEHLAPMDSLSDHLRALERMGHLLSRQRTRSSR